MTSMHATSAIALSVFMVSATACSMTKFAADSTVDVMKAGNAAVAEETNPALAKMGLEGNLKLMEGLMYSTPDNATLYRLATEAFGSYAFGFLEPKLWSMDPNSGDTYAYRMHVKSLYERALKYAKRLVELTDSDMHRALGSHSALKSALAGEVPVETLEALYWVAQAQGQLVSVDPEDLENIADIGLADLIMGKIAKDNTSYEAGAAAVFIGTNLSIKGKGLAGDMNKAKAAFDQAIAVTDGKYLLPRFMKGRHYCEAVSDRTCFTKTLKEVVDADPNQLPERRLTNLLAQQWAQYWLGRVDELF